MRPAAKVWGLSRSHPDVTCALAEAKPSTISVKCEEGVLVSSLAALSVRTGEKLFEKQAPGARGWVSEGVFRS